MYPGMIIVMNSCERIMIHFESFDFYKSYPGIYPGTNCTPIPSLQVQGPECRVFGYPGLHTPIQTFVRLVRA